MPKHLMHRVINIAIQVCEFVTKELWKKIVLSLNNSSEPGWALLLFYY